MIQQTGIISVYKYKESEELLMKKILFSLVMLFVFTLLHAQEYQWKRYPSLSPDGKWIAFSYQDDIYVVAAEGGRARQLTVNEAYDFRPVWSPDGKTRFQV